MPCNFCKKLISCPRERRYVEERLVNTMCVDADSVEDNSGYLLL